MLPQQTWAYRCYHFRKSFTSLRQ